MSKLRNLSLRSSLTALVLFFISMLAAVGAIAMQQLWSISQKQRAMYTETVMPLRVVVDAARQGATHFRRMYVYIWRDWRYRPTCTCSTRLRPLFLARYSA